VKDTVLPAAPTATPGPGAYAGPQTVSLASADQSAAIHYTVDGGTPTALSRRFDAPLSLTASQTIRAVAVDPAGNESAAATLPFTILPASAGGAATGGTNTSTLITQLIPVVAQPSVAGASTRAALRVSDLRLARRISISRARSRGLSVAMTLPKGTQVVRLAVYRSRNGLASGRPLARMLKLPTRSGRYVVQLRSRALLRSLRPGRYAVQVTPGRSLDDRGRTSSLAFTITP
jgi:hypothetical protein